MRFTFDEIRTATGAEAIGGRVSASMRIVTDTRGLEPGDAFLALRGERFDGHDFVGEAYARGAALAVVARADAVPPGRPALVVADTTRAYMALAGTARARSSARFIAITGSTGKTTTKSFLAQLLGLAGLRLSATPQNENNEIGVSKLLLSLDGDEQVVVVEIGCRHYGEIAELVAIARPHVGVLSNIGEAHLEIMGTRERIAETKWGLFSSGASAILNRDDAESRKRAETLGDREIVWFAANDVSSYGSAPAFPGQHNLANLAAAIAAARSVGVSADAIVRAIPLLVLPPGRYERIALGGGATLVYDAYNASLSGTLATLEAFAREAGARRIAILGGMAELGVESAKMHAQAGAAVHAKKIDLLLAGGEHAEATAQGARDAGMRADAVVIYRDNADAVEWLRTNLRSDDAILLKGSRMYKMEEIVAALRGGSPVGAH